MPNKFCSPHGFCASGKAKGAKGRRRKTAAPSRGGAVSERPKQIEEKNATKFM
jgi:hypothetical protein